MTTKQQWCHIRRTAFGATLFAICAGGTAYADAFRDCDDCPEMVEIPAGTFMMGSPESEAGRAPTEDPRHEVSIAPFALGRMEVTFAQWDACVAAGGCSNRPDDQWGRGDMPVMRVSWGDVQEYVAWLSDLTGQAYRLPTEGEWEYAARAGTTTARYWGDEVGSGNANCHGCGSQWDGEQTAPVGSFAPNQFGLYDMMGNVWEWVQDCWQESYTGAPTDGSPWEDGECTERVVRGSAWHYFPTPPRSALRSRNKPDWLGYMNGFRVARDG